MFRLNSVSIETMAMDSAVCSTWLYNAPNRMRRNMDLLKRQNPSRVGRKATSRCEVMNNIAKRYMWYESVAMSSTPEGNVAP